MRWHENATATQKKRSKKACEAVHAHFGSYGKVAAAVIEETGYFISDETIRNYLTSYNVPTHIACTLAEMVPDVELFDLVPWLPHYLRSPDL